MAAQESIRSAPDIARTPEWAAELSAIVGKIGQTVNGKGLAFDADAFARQLNGTVAGTLEAPSIPKSAKLRFLRDLSKRLDVAASGVTRENVGKLRNARIRESIGKEADEPEAFYVGLLLNRNVGDYALEASAGLREAFAAERTEFAGRTYGKSGFDRLLSELIRIDAVSGIDSKELLAACSEDLSNPSSASGILLSAIAKLSPENAATTRSFVGKNGLPETGWHKSLSFRSAKGEDLPLAETVNAYAAALARFRARESEIRIARNAAESSDAVAETKAFL